MTSNHTEYQAYLKRLESMLIDQYGFVVAIKELARILSFKSANALQQTIGRGQISLPLFKMDNRRGLYALTVDIAEWLTIRRFDAVNQIKQQTEQEVPMEMK